MKIKIKDISYQNLTTVKLYKGSNLLWERKTDEQPPVDYGDVDVVLKWNSRTASNSGSLTSSNASSYSRLAVKINGKRYQLDKYLEEDPSTITKFKYSDIIGTANLTSLDDFGAGYQYYHPMYGPETPKPNSYLTDILYMRIPNTVTSMYDFLYYCTSLVSMNVDWDLSNITVFSGILSGPSGYVFYSNLKDVTGNIRGIKKSFNITHCSELTNKSMMVFINGLDEVTSKQTISFSNSIPAERRLTSSQLATATAKGWTVTYSMYS